MLKAMIEKIAEMAAPKTYDIEVPMDRIPVFTQVK